MQRLTEQQTHILRHSLGLTNSASRYRNHFVTGEGSDDHADCMALVDAGLMVRRAGNALTGGDDLFMVTEKGLAFALASAPQPERLTRDQNRYQAFLRADSGLSFGQWLKARHYRITAHG